MGRRGHRSCKGTDRGLNPSCCRQDGLYPHRLMMVTNTIVASRKDCKLKNSPCSEIEKVIIHLRGSMSAQGQREAPF